MGKLASGVVVVTMRAEMEDHGFTATSVTSVSLDPALVLVCVLKRQRSHALIEEAQHFAVNILSAGQKELGGAFASAAVRNRFAGIDVVRALSGAPILRGSQAWVDCKLRETFDGGDHSIFLGEVLAGETQKEGAPLLYYDRAWGRFEPA
jgi:flavin reductase (DIM6/NTAB) family NADH-FMN oxidoreductase RutF